MGARMPVASTRASDPSRSNETTDADMCPSVCSYRTAPRPEPQPSICIERKAVDFAHARCQGHDPALRRKRCPVEVVVGGDAAGRADVERAVRPDEAERGVEAGLDLDWRSVGGGHDVHAVLVGIGIVGGRDPQPAGTRRSSPQPTRNPWRTPSRATRLGPGGRTRCRRGPVPASAAVALVHAVRTMARR